MSECVRQLPACYDEMVGIVNPVRLASSCKPLATGMALNATYLGQGVIKVESGGGRMDQDGVSNMLGAGLHGHVTSNARACASGAV